MPPRILIVEDETVLRASMARGLAKLPAIVDEAATMADAVSHLERALPDVIISDLDLPDGSGIELIGTLGRLRARVPLIFVSAYLRAYRAQIPPHADVEVREKPIELDELRGLVRDRLAPRADEAAPFGVADYVQLACLGNHSVSIDVIGRDRRRGRVVVVSGEVWHAEDERGTGVDAFRRLAFATGAEVFCRTRSGAPGDRTIEGKWEALLMDSARVHDEHSRAARRAGRASELGDDDFELDFALGTDDGPRMSAPPPPPPPVDEFGTTFDRAVEALLRRDYTAAVEAFAVAHTLRPDDQRVITNLERLAALGHRATTPTTEEEHDA